MGTDFPHPLVSTRNTRIDQDVKPKQECLTQGCECFAEEQANPFLVG